MKKLKRHIISLVIVSLLVFYIILRNDFSEIVNVLLNANKKYIFIGVLIVLLGDLFKSLSVSSIIKKSKRSFKFKDAFLLTLKTNFFNGVTPFSLGGQPFQLYSLKKVNKINYVTGAGILFKDFYTYQIALLLLSSICLVLNYIFNIVVFDGAIKNLIALGYLINFVIGIVLIYLPFSKSNAKKIIELSIYILNKLKLIKDKDTTINNINESVIDLKNQIKVTLKDKVLIVWCVLLNMIKISTIGITTYFCFKGVDASVSMLACIVITIIIITITSFVPIPGASGGMEYGFIALFASLVIDVKLASALLVWRFLTYYMMLFVGAIFAAFESKEGYVCE